MPDDPNAVNVHEGPRQAPRPLTRREREQRAATTLWFAVQRLLRRKSEPPGPSVADLYPPGSPDVDDGKSGSGVPRRPLSPSGAAAATAELPEDDVASRDIHRR